MHFIRIGALQSTGPFHKLYTYRHFYYMPPGRCTFAPGRLWSLSAVGGSGHEPGGMYLAAETGIVGIFIPLQPARLFWPDVL